METLNYYVIFDKDNMVIGIANSQKNAEKIFKQRYPKMTINDAYLEGLILEIELNKLRTF